MRRLPTIAVLAICFGAIAACASATRSSGERESVEAFVEGDYAAAISTFEDRLEDLPSDRSDARLELELALALALAVPGHAAHDELRARALLEELAASPETGGEARAVIHLLDAIDGAEAELAATRPQLDRLVELQSAFVELVSTCSQEASALARDVETRDARIEQLAQRLDAVEAEARRLANELEQLKQIDLARPE